MKIVRHLVRSLIDSGVVRGSATALAIKFTGSILGFAMFALAAREMETAAFGRFAVIFNAMSFLSVVALCGQETLIVRSWDEYCRSGRYALARGALIFGARVVLGAATLTVLLVVGLWSVIDPAVMRPMLIAACGFLFAQSLINFNSQFSRVAAGIVIGDGPREIVWRSIVVIAILASHQAQSPFTAVDFLLTAAAALALGVVLQWWRVAPMIPLAVKQTTAKSDLAAWVPRSFRMWLSSILDTSGQYLEVIVIGLFLEPTGAAFYFVATRITNVFPMIAASTTAYATSQISALFYTDARDDLQAILRSLAIVSATLSAGAFVVILATGQLLLSAFGAGYVSAYPVLLVLAIGASATALGGPAAYLLLLTGNEGTYPKVLAGGLVLRFLLIAVLAPLFGLMGAAVAWSVCAGLTTLALVMACRRLIRLDPSVVSLFRRRQPPAQGDDRGTSARSRSSVVAEGQQAQI